MLDDRLAGDAGSVVLGLVVVLLCVLSLCPSVIKIFY